MIDDRTGRDLKDYPVLTDEQVYIYVMETDEHKIKIGQTKNILQRYQSLCGSNSQGHPPIKVTCSFKTYLYTIERIMHDKFDKYRLSGTEWFYDPNITSEGYCSKLTYENVVNELRTLFSSTSYNRCNELRKSLILERIEKEKTIDENE